MTSALTAVSGTGSVRRARSWSGCRFDHRIAQIDAIEHLVCPTWLVARTVVERYLFPNCVMATWKRVAGVTSRAHLRQRGDLSPLLRADHSWEMARRG